MNQTSTGTVPKNDNVSDTEFTRSAAILRASPMFQHCKDETLEKIVKKMDVVSYGPGEVLIRQGQRTSQLFVLIDGEIERVRVEDGKLNQMKSKTFKNRVVGEN